MVELTKRLLLAFFLLSMASCTSLTHDAPSDPQLEQDDLFLTVDWYGVHTKGLPKAGFASEGRAKDLNHWLREDPIYRSGMIISRQERDRVWGLLRDGKFEAHKTINKPALQVQQYVLTWRSSNPVVYFPLGFDSSTRGLLADLKGALNEPSTRLLDRIIARVPDRKDAGKTGLRTR